MENLSVRRFITTRVSQMRRPLDKQPLNLRPDQPEPTILKNWCVGLRVMTTCSNDFQKMIILTRKAIPYDKRITVEQ